MTDKINDDQLNDKEELTTNITKEMRQSFLDYSMSVIVARALPDVRDGMKPVHRRIMFAMENLNMQSDKPYRKSAMLVGEVMGKYHPHGDSAIYSSMVRMAQDFSFRYPLVQGQGNFGSIDGDEAAAMRYTEARMSKIAGEMMRDINKNTVDFVDNYDASLKEPSVLPARFPQLLVNGGMGIAVGMATNIPPHNLGETIDAAIAVMENPDISTSELMTNYIYGPDFPTGGLILGRSGIKKAFETGRGSIVVRSRSRIEEMGNGKKRIIIYEIPYGVNKAKTVEKIAELVREKQIEGITELRDESNRDGIRVVIELRKDIQADIILNQLFRLTPLQSNFGCNMLTLVNNQPKLLGIKDLLSYYIDHQVEVVVRKTQYEYDKAIDRAHLLEGFIIALDHIDEVISIIRGSHDDSEVIKKFDEKFNLSEVQARAILDMRLRRLTGLEREKIEAEYKEILELIEDYKDILANHSRVLAIIKEDLLDIKAKRGDARRSEIIEGVFDMEDEDLIPNEEIIIAMTVNGYIKRNTIDTFHTQNRGGRGIKGMGINDDDTIEKLITMKSHDY
ncbi:MAG: DNA topoisomerase 4 subunit A, partial [Erysipelothrix sp.]|nr:DNA topoisomerase 4 subunit A [Erysipelothrix sp.]